MDKVDIWAARILVFLGVVGLIVYSGIAFFPDWFLPAFSWTLMW